MQTDIAGRPSKPALKTRLTLRPGTAGTKRLTQKYGDRLIAVRYRYDATRGMRLKTVELIEEEQRWTPPPQPNPDELQLVRIGWDEPELRSAVRAAGGRWQPHLKLWVLPRRAVEALDLQGRVQQ